MVIFKKRWCRIFLERLTDIEGSGFHIFYSGRIPRNVTADDIVALATPDIITKCMTPPSAAHLGYGTSGGVDYSESLRFHDNKHGPGYITYAVERGGIVFRYQDDDINKVFKEYVQMQLDYSGWD